MFGFKKVEKENYSSTFLRKVVINIKFPTTLLVKEKAKEVIDIFKNDFPRTTMGKNQGFQISIGGRQEQPNFKTINEDDNISLKTEDGQTELLINSDNITISIEGNKYKSYETNVVYILKNVLKLFEILSIESITNISLRKINLIEFDYNTSNVPNGILNTLLNNSIVYDENAYPSMDFITQNIHNVGFKDGDYFLNLIYGMNTLPIPEKKIGQLVVDNDITSNKEISTTELINEMNTLNNELFNVFYWMFNDDAKNVLRNGKA